MVTNRQGIHARSAIVIAELARKFRARIELVTPSERAECTNVLHLMTLGLAQGRRLKVVAEGVDATQAADAMAQLIGEGLRQLEDGDDAPPGPRDVSRAG